VYLCCSKFELLRLKYYNDPIYGFISIPTPLISALIQEPVVQRLRRIHQMGLSYYVYTGATHSRFEHALGAMYLMSKTLDCLQQKGTLITDHEREAAQIAILLHDLGHGPFSHALEGIFSEGFSHEEISLSLMEKLNAQYEGKLETAIEMFKAVYHRPFFNQLIASQLDMDRLDYLKRDSFYSGVTEGNINSERIIAMLCVHDDVLMVEEKGIYSIEKFLLARRLMYWSVYLHKTSFAAEEVLKRIFKRAKYLINKGFEVELSPALHYFLSGTYSKDQAEQTLNHFSSLDDIDVMSMIKSGVTHADLVFSTLCTSILDRKLPKIRVTQSPPSSKKIEEKKELFNQSKMFESTDVDYFVFDGQIENRGYNRQQFPIHVLDNTGDVRELSALTDDSNLAALTKPVTKYYFCYPK
jgi:HD superfamily phosphohydrolase